MNTTHNFTRTRSPAIELLLFIAALVCFLAPKAKANDFEPFTLQLPAGFTIAAGTTNTALASSNIVFSVSAGTKAAVQMTHKLGGAGTTPVVWGFDASNDGVRWEPLAFSLSVTPSGTTQVSKIGHFDVGGVLYLRLSRCANPNANAVTEIVGNASTKRSG